jgi:hypothetical protein
MRIFRRLAAFGLFLAACTALGQTSAEKLTIYKTEYFPLHVGNEWNYKVKVGDAQWQALQIAVDHEEIFLFKTVKDKKEKETPIKRYRLKATSGSKELTEYVAILSDGVYKFTVAGKEIVPPLPILKLPKFDSWKVDSVSENAPLVGKFACVDETVEVPAGKFTAKHVSAHDFQFDSKKMTLEFWFAENVGIVKQHTTIGNNDTLMELEKKPNLKN